MSQEQEVKPAERDSRERACLGMRDILGIGISFIVVAFAAVYIAQV
ncbi:MAG: hypothetical protein KDJ23_15350 [Rhodoblastus sp.]|nr:hypothetical protein [Rhodoblastus sp.]MCB1536928.1 hypothetical protein [Rhodoblastus sp.]